MKRFYRTLNVNNGLNSYEIKYKESDLFIKSCDINKFSLFSFLKHLRDDLDEYINRNTNFLKSLMPINMDKNAPLLAKQMINAAKIAAVGPMACVAGAFAQNIGRYILQECSECIVENGGDIFLKLNNEPIVNIYTTNPYFKDKICFKLKQSNMAYGICSSSAKIGPSLSLGNADIAVIIGYDVIICDGIATATANMIKSKNDLNKAVKFSKEKNVIGCIFIKDDKIAIWGNIQIM